jgi:hypothetical protein
LFGSVIANLLISDLFGSVIAVAFQNAFHLEMYQNNILLLFLKNYF